MKEFLVSENMIMWAFRYSLGRRTGAVSDVIETLKKHWQKLEPFTQGQIKQEIGQAIGLDQAGDKCDVDHWAEILKLKDY